MKINILGTGGAFDVKEGNSSMVITNKDNTNILVDCGYDVFPKLLNQNLADKIDKILITHFHDDHIGSLSAYLYYCFYILKKKMTVVSPTLDLEILLQYMGMTADIEYRLMKYDHDISVQALITDGRHVPDMQSYGYIFDDRLVYSGDIASPLMDKTSYSFLNNDRYIIFHDASTFDSGVHCLYTSLDKNMPNLRLYHHSEQQRNEMEANGYKCLRTGIFDIDEL